MITNTTLSVKKEKSFQTQFLQILMDNVYSNHCHQQCTAKQQHDDCKN